MDLYLETIAFCINSTLGKGLRVVCLTSWAFAKLRKDGAESLFVGKHNNVFQNVRAS